MKRKMAQPARLILCVGLVLAEIFAVSSTQPGRIRSRQAVAMAAYSLSTEITNLPFTDSLLNPDTIYYKYLESLVDSVLTETYNISGATAGHYLGTADMKFTRGQLINVETTILFSLSPTSLNTILLTYIFEDYMSITTSTPFRINHLSTYMTKTTIPTTTRIPSTYSTRGVPTSESTPPTTSSSMVGPQQPVDSTAYCFYMEITNQLFQDSLLNPSSAYYKLLKSEVEDLICHE
ncbi:uncharacterized protein LOC121696142 [Alosa sapidissima]|uniref:uncharacterized protein LOC121696142 n=1 Tax=Alosa sapidissima TaxID=34773 RepID=UPI001C0A2EFF|nr:uncharacterized protein LOC121696142 [Alosa sapidissima]